MGETAIILDDRRLRVEKLWEIYRREKVCRFVRNNKVVVYLDLRGFVVGSKKLWSRDVI